MICLSLQHESPSGLLELVRQHSNYADIIEIRLDLLGDPFSMEFHKVSSCCNVPVIYTNRIKQEGGAFHGSEEQRLSLLERAIEAGADYIDIEFLTDRDLLSGLMEKARGGGTKVIVSYHDFHGTPEEDQVNLLFSRMAETGPDVIKIVTMASDRTDFFRLAPAFRLAESHSIPLIAFCMGEHGRFSRVCSLFFGAFLTFASPDSGSVTAPGQIPIRKMQQILSLMKPV